MRHERGDILPFQSETYGPHLRDDVLKPGRTMSQWSWFWMRINFFDFTAAATTQALDISALATTLFNANSNRVSGPVPSDALLGWWAYDLKRVFSGGSVGSCTLIQGVSGTTNGHLTSTNVFTGATLGRKQTPAATLFQPQVPASALLLQMDTTVANINTLTQGQIDIYAQFCRNPFSQPAT